MSPNAHMQSSTTKQAISTKQTARTCSVRKDYNSNPLLMSWMPQMLRVPHTPRMSHTPHTSHIPRTPHMPHTPHTPCTTHTPQISRCLGCLRRLGRHSIQSEMHMYSRSAHRISCSLKCMQAVMIRQGGRVGVAIQSRQVLSNSEAYLW